MCVCVCILILQITKLRLEKKELSPEPRVCELTDSVVQTFRLKRHVLFFVEEIFPIYFCPTVVPVAN